MDLCGSGQGQASRARQAENRPRTPVHLAGHAGHTHRQAHQNNKCPHGAPGALRSTRHRSTRHRPRAERPCALTRPGWRWRYGPGGLDLGVARQDAVPYGACARAQGLGQGVAHLKNCAQLREPLELSQPLEPLAARKRGCRTAAMSLGSILDPTFYCGADLMSTKSVLKMRSTRRSVLSAKSVPKVLAEYKCRHVSGLPFSHPPG